MAGRVALDLSAEEIVEAAVGLFLDEGLDAVSMRRVAARVGVSPVPLYSRVGTKEALLEAMADRLLADVAPTRPAEEPWQAYAARWATALRDRHLATPELPLLVGGRRQPYLAAAAPLVEALRAGGFTDDQADQACRLLTWATLGFVVVEGPAGDRPAGGRAPRRHGRSARSRAQRDRLFALQIGYVIDGLERDPEALDPR